jgi:glyoxylase-like metal-dependent hydrolase (beta-lactamase superfamily II)
MEHFSTDGLVCRRLTLGPFQVNTYLIHDPESGELLIIDPALSGREMSAAMSAVGAKSVMIFLTHGHADHILGVEALKKETGAQVVISREDAPMLADPMLNLSQFLGTPITVSSPDRLVEHGQTLRLGTHEATAIAVPGHSPGGMALAFPHMLFSGDTLFAGSIGRSDFPRGDGPLLVKMIRERLLTLTNRPVFPGHGPETDLAAELDSNPFLHLSECDH